MQLLQRLVATACAVVLIGTYLAGVDTGGLPHDRGAVTFLDRTGAPLGTILASDASHAVSVPLRAISPRFIEATLAAEDARFYTHGAIDLFSLARAAREIVYYGEVRSGGSTISMQVAHLLTQTPSSLRGKLMQIVEAERISARSSREAILEAYANRAPMGGNLYGVEAASRTYFGEPASDLDLAQATLLAAIPNDPARLAPDVNLRALRERQRYVLDRMVALHDITRDDAVRALRETVSIRRHDDGITDAPHALFALFTQMPPTVGRAQTTIDRGLQRFVQAQAADVVAALGERHVTDAAALVVDNHTGEVLAYVGSPDYFSDEALGRNDGVQALRQPGSSLKPFTYELALERGAITSTTILPDVPSSFALPGGKLYEPADYSGRFNGPVRVRYALANSLNVPAVRVLAAIGPDTLLQRLHALGFTHLDKPASYYGLGLTLGGGEVTLWELVHAYTAIARDGNLVDLRLLRGASPGSQSVGDAATWELITDMLADPHARAHSFGMHSVLEMPFDAAVKTGTSSDFRDTWTVGFTRDYTVGTWVGNFDGTPMRGISGVTGAGPLWNRIMLHLHEREEPKRFDTPRGFVRTPICATTGHAPDATCSAIVDEWVRPRDLAHVRDRARPRLGHEYDAWLALQPARDGVLRIVSPGDGSVFYFNAPASALQRDEQLLPLRASGAGSVSWRVDGKPIAPDADGRAFWPLQLGSHVVEARTAARVARVTIHVSTAPHQQHPGFTRQ